MDRVDSNWEAFYVNYAVEGASDSGHRRQAVLKNKQTGKIYALPTPSETYSNAATLRYGKYETRKSFLLHATIGLPISMIVGIFKTIKQSSPFIADCITPITHLDIDVIDDDAMSVLQRGLQHRAKAFAECCKIIVLQPVTLVTRELINLYGIAKPFEATALLARYKLSGIEGGPITEELSKQENGDRN